MHGNAFLYLTSIMLKTALVTPQLSIGERGGPAWADCSGAFWFILCCAARFPEPFDAFGDGFCSGESKGARSLERGTYSVWGSVIV